MAVYDLGLTNEAFYNLTHRQLHALVTRHNINTRSNEFLFAQLTSVLVNCGPNPPKKSTTPFDFMPSEFGKRRKKDTKKNRWTAKRRHEQFLYLRASFGVTGK